MKKILIVANGAISNIDSNGRTIARLFDCFSKEEKAQFYTYGDPDYSQCISFYKVSDNDVLNSVIKLRKIDGREVYKKIENQISEKPALKKTPLILILREFLWKLGLWRNKYLKQWIDSINPNCIFLYLGDNYFTIDLAIWISKIKSIPIIVYSTEEYSFKNYNYITKRKSIFYNIWYIGLKQRYKKLCKYTKLGLFNSEELTELYRKTYNYPCITLYQNSNIDFFENYNVQKKQIISYLGNLRLNRHKALIEIAKALYIIDKTIIFDIYGKPDEEIKTELERQCNIVVHDFVPYSKVVEIIHKSSLLIHAEFSDSFYNRDLKYGFSTKITDSICSGTPLFMYTPEELICTKFVQSKQCAFHTSSKENLISKLKIAIFDEVERQRIIQNAKIVKDKYFTNHGMLKVYIEKVIHESIAG